jgi:hypothetical protein
MAYETGTPAHCGRCAGRYTQGLQRRAQWGKVIKSRFVVV